MAPAAATTRWATGNIRSCKTYFDNIRATMSSVAALANERTVIVQMVAFSEPDWQLPRYLETMEQAGLAEMIFRSRGKATAGYGAACPAAAGTTTSAARHPAAQEVVLFHRKATDRPSIPDRKLQPGAKQAADSVNRPDGTPTRRATRCIRRGPLASTEGDSNSMCRPLPSASGTMS